MRRATACRLRWVSRTTVWSTAFFPHNGRAYSSSTRTEPVGRFAEVLEWNSLVQDSALEPRSAENNTIEIWQDMLEEGIRPALSTYFRVIKGLMRTNRLSELLYFFQDMKHRGFLPTTGLYNMAIYACGNAKEIEKAYALYEEMERYQVPRELATYGSLLRACARCGEFERALATVKEMLGKDLLTPNVHIYTELVGSVRTEEHLEQVTQVLRQLRNQPAFDSLLPLNRFIGKCIELGYTQRGLECLELMLTSPEGPRPDIRSFFSAIKSLCLADNPDYEQAVKLFVSMKEFGLPSEPAFFEVLLRQFTHPERQEVALNLFEEMMTDRITPTGRTWYVALMGAISNENDVAAHRLWDAMMESSFLPNIHMCNSYLEFCCSRSLETRAAQARERLATHPPDYLQRSSKLLEEKEQDVSWLEEAGN